MKKKNLKNLNLNKKSISNVQQQHISGGDFLETFNEITKVCHTFGYRCWSIGCVSDECSMEC